MRGEEEKKMDVRNTDCGKEERKEGKKEGKKNGR